MNKNCYEEKACFTTVNIANTSIYTSSVEKKCCCCVSNIQNYPCFYFHYFATQFRVDIPQFFHLLNLRCLLSVPGNFPKHFHGNLTKIDI